MSKLYVKVLKRPETMLSEIPLPSYATEHSAGMDARADIKEDVVIEPMKRAIIPTGLYVAVPWGHTLDVDSRSGLAAKSGVFVMNAPGIIDADYRGEICVILANMSDKPFTVKRGDRVCQLLLRAVEHVLWEEVNQLDDTERGAGGLGSTGVK